LRLDEFLKRVAKLDWGVGFWVRGAFHSIAHVIEASADYAIRTGTF
jgi:hypothetical protein